MDDVITLVSKQWSVDSIGQRHETETEREVFCSISGVTRSEWNAAVGRGFNPSIVAVVNFNSYSGEQVAKWRNEYYYIYRTYFSADSDSMELYMEKRTGISNAEH